MYYLICIMTLKVDSTGGLTEVVSCLLSHLQKQR